MDFAFYLFSFLTLLCGALVVFNPVNRNPVNSAMFLVLSIVAMAGLFVLLHAYFLAAVQILVYAGAVMVLFLFVIMLLNLEEEERRRLHIFAVGFGGLAVTAVAAVLARIMWRYAATLAPAAPTLEGGTRQLGLALFRRFILPFEILSVLLLAGMVGVILLSKKDLK